MTRSLGAECYVAVVTVRKCPAVDKLAVTRSIVNLGFINIVSRKALQN